MAREIDLISYGGLKPGLDEDIRRDAGTGVMDREAAKELLHIEGWLARAGEIVSRDKDAYLADDFLQEAGTHS